MNSILLTVALLAPATEPQKTIRYADLLLLVEAGLEAEVTIGLDPTPGRLAVRGDPAVVPGVYRVYRENSKPMFRPVVSVVKKTLARLEAATERVSQACRPGMPCYQAVLPTTALIRDGDKPPVIRPR